MYPTIKFNEFLKSFRWKQGEHVMLAAPTQCGKSTLASIIVRKRRATVVMASKVTDNNLKRCYRDYYKVSTWPPPRNEYKVLLWPKRTDTLADMITVQREQFKNCLDGVGREGGWCVVVDEAHWASQFLKLDKEIAILHHQGASSGVSMVVLTQRPAWIPRIIYSSASHVFLGQTAYRDDLKALASMGGINSKDVQESVEHLGRHDLLYINPLGTHDPVVINVRR